MKWIKSFGISLVLVIMVDACLQQPEYSVVPVITKSDLYFIPAQSGNDSDSLIVRFDFKDGDGDLGIGTLDSTATNYYDYFSPWYYAYDTSNFSVGFSIDRTITLPSKYKWIDLDTKNKVPQFDTLPALNCQNWEQVTNNSGATKTFYITQNPNAFNMRMDFYTRDSNGNYVLFDPFSTFPNCSPHLFWGTFKELSSDRGKKAPIEGTFAYKYPSAALNFLLSGQTLKLQVSIFDRQFHQSNVLEWKDFTLASITRK